MTLLPLTLQNDFELKVQAGDKISSGDILALKKTPSKEEVIHLSKNYEVDLNNEKSLKKSLGDFININEVLAVKGGVLGGKKILSPFSGTVVKIDKDRGDVYIRTETEGKEEHFTSPVDGIVDFCDNEKIVIKTQSDLIVSDFALGEETTGVVILLQDSENINDKLKGQIILSDKIDKISVFKAWGLGITGLIYKETDEDFWDELLIKRIKMAVLEVNQENFNKLLKLNGKKILVKPKEKTILVL